MGVKCWFCFECHGARPHQLGRSSPCSPCSPFGLRVAARGSGPTPPRGSAPVDGGCAPRPRNRRRDEGHHAAPRRFALALRAGSNKGLMEKKGSRIVQGVGPARRLRRGVSGSGWYFHASPCWWLGQAVKGAKTGAKSRLGQRRSGRRFGRSCGLDDPGFLRQIPRG